MSSQLSHEDQTTPWEAKVRRASAEIGRVTLAVEGVGTIATKLDPTGTAEAAGQQAEDEPAEEAMREPPLRRKSSQLRVPAVTKNPAVDGTPPTTTIELATSSPAIVDDVLSVYAGRPAEEVAPDKAFLSAVIVPTLMTIRQHQRARLNPS
ncbi:unnamed protein product [Linum trigynum]|uniref:Uncharacterized protein n=1 Tax=Linum trigynum TaxID=586398 RepID=A0AAV2G574_9ROSI